MKLTKSKLQQIIKEELGGLREGSMFQALDKGFDIAGLGRLSMDDILDMPNKDYHQLATMVQRAKSMRRERAMARNMSDEKAAEFISAMLSDTSSPGSVVANLKGESRMRAFLDMKNEKLGALYDRTIHKLHVADNKWVAAPGAERSPTTEKQFAQAIKALEKILKAVS